MLLVAHHQWEASAVTVIVDKLDLKLTKCGSRCDIWFTSVVLLVAIHVDQGTFFRLGYGHDYTVACIFGGIAGGQAGALLHQDKQ